MKVIGTSKISVQNKVTIIEQVAKELGVFVGDRLAFLRSDSGDIIIKNLSDVEIKEME